MLVLQCSLTPWRTYVPQGSSLKPQSAGVVESWHHASLSTTFWDIFLVHFEAFFIFLEQTWFWQAVIWLCGLSGVQQSSTILPSNKVHYRASPEAYGALEKPLHNRNSTTSLESSNKVHLLFDHFSHFRLHLWGSQLFCSIFEDSIDMTKLRAWLWYHVRNHDSPQWYDIIHFEHKLSWLCFEFP